MSGMQILDLFSGIGGFSLGLERAGMTTAAFCEIDPFCTAVLNARWPGVYVHDDIRTLSADTLRRRGVDHIDIICGGFPCQDLSVAGKRAGIEGARSGLWGQYARLIRELRPRWVIVENVSGLLSAGMGRVLGDLAALGYDAEWDCIPAAAVGAPHIRERIWIVAHASSVGQPPARDAERHGPATGNGQADWSGSGGEVLPDRDAPHGQGKRISSRVQAANGEPRSDLRGPREEHGHAQSRLGRVDDGIPRWMDPADWLVEPKGVPRVTKGIENRAQRLMALGNSVVPQIIELIGKAIVEAEKQETENEQPSF